MTFFIWVPSLNNKKLTVIVGAGASRELGLPTGAELKKEISSLLNIRFAHGIRQQSGDFSICEALRAHVRDSDNHLEGLNPHLYAAWRIRDAMPQAISIDNFIDTHQGDVKIELCGKLAIAKAIIDAERRSLLYVDPSSGETKFDFSQTEATWVNNFFKIITENCRAVDLKKRLSEISLIIFNYDRCTEHYLYTAIQNYYALSAQDAASLVNSMDIYHPYGTVGLLPWQSDKSSTEFGAELNSTELLSIAKQIKTFTEGTNPDSSEVTEIRNATKTSARLVFLGFAFHKLNMELLRTQDELPLEDKSKRVFATAMGISRNDIEEIVEELAGMGNCEIPNIHVRNDLVCHAIFPEFARGISLQ